MDKRETPEQKKKRKKKMKSTKYFSFVSSVLKKEINRGIEGGDM